MAEDRANPTNGPGDGLAFEISVEQLAELKSTHPLVCLLDVREPWELDLCRFDGSLDIPLDELADRLGEVPDNAPVVVICHHGQRSAYATHWLRSAGRQQAVNLGGGIDAWARRIDVAMRIY
jgi:rhodanese-related sulfurtransferase